MNKHNLKKARSVRTRAHLRSRTIFRRLSVYRSSAHIWVQLIDDRAHKTLLSSSDTTLKGTKTEKAVLVGKKIAELAKKAKIDRVIFDRGSYRYHGRVKALAEAARQSGLKF